PDLEYRVQYNESDYAFLCRMCEDAGLSFFFEDDEGAGGRGTSVAVFSDAPGIATLRHEAPLCYVDHPNEAAPKQFLTRVRLTHEGRPAAITLRDVDFWHPALSLAVQASRSEGLLPHYRYLPGAFRVVTRRSSATPVADRDGTARHDPIIGQRLAE